MLFREWDIDIPLDNLQLPFLSSGECVCGAVYDGPVNALGLKSAISCELYSLSFKGCNSLQSYPVVSPHAAIHSPGLLTSMSTECAQFRTWMNLRPVLTFPSVFSPVFDIDSIRCYEKIFSLLIKVLAALRHILRKVLIFSQIRLIARALEKLWISGSCLLPSQIRVFNLIRHAMHFFLSNILYYFQVRGKYILILGSNVFVG
jgi:hypothetical protein